MDELVKKVWNSSQVEPDLIPPYADDDAVQWKIWASKKESLRYLTVCHIRGHTTLEKAIAHEIIKGLSKDVNKYESAKDVFNHVCESWKLWIVGRHKDDIENLLPTKGRFFITDFV